MTTLDRTLMTLCTTLPLVSRAYQAAANKMAGDFGLSHASAWPVVMIGRLGDGVRPGAVADALGLEAPSLVRVIEQLVVAGLVLRHDDATDRRAKTLHLTDEGKQCAARLEKALMPFRRQFFTGMDPDDIAACARILTELNAVLAEPLANRPSNRPANTSANKPGAMPANRQAKTPASKPAAATAPSAAITSAKTPARRSAK